MLTSTFNLQQVLDNWNTNVRAAAKRLSISPKQLAAQMDLSESTYHRYLSGASPWKLSHYLYLQQRLKLSASRQEDEPDQLRFRDTSSPGEFDDEAYLGSLTLLAAAADQPAARLKVATAELPIFYLFTEPVLTQLKLYLFTQTRRDRPTKTFVLPNPAEPRRQQLLTDAQAIVCAVTAAI